MQETNQNSKNVYDNPKYLEMSDKYADKYEVKEAFQEADVVIWTRMLYVALHGIIVMGTVAMPQFITILSYGERLALSVFLAVIAISLEYFKGTYMERYFIQKYLSEDGRRKPEFRKTCSKKKGLNFRILSFFWVISVVLFCTTGTFYAKKYFASSTEIGYDKSIERAFNAATSAFEKSTKENAGSKALRELGDKVAVAQTAWTDHKKNIDDKNATLDANTDQDKWQYGIIGALLCFLLEFALFGSRGFHEKEEYKIATSLPSIEGNDAQEPKKSSGDDVAALKAKLEKQQAALKAFADENKKFDTENAALVARHNQMVAALENEKRITETLKSVVNPGKA